MANGDETQVSLEPLSGKCLDDKFAHRIVVRINGRHKNNITAFLQFAVKLEHGTDEDNDPCIKLGRVVKLKPVLIWKGETEGRIKREVTGLNRKMRCMVQTVTKKGKTNVASMLYIGKETLRHAIPLGEGEQCVFTADGAPAHMHASVALAFKNANLWLYITAPNCTPYNQACDKKKINRSFKSSLEENYAEWVEDKLMGKKRKQGPVPVPSREETATWVLEAFDAITEDDIRAACRAAYFPKGMKLSELEDLKYFANSDSDSSGDSDSDSGTDTDDDGRISESSSSDDSSDSDDEPTEVVWAKAARGVWGMAHVFDGNLYFTRDHLQGNFIPKNLTLPKPKPAPKPQPKASSSGEHVQLFRMVYDRKKGFRAEHL